MSFSATILFTPPGRTEGVPEAGEGEQQQQPPPLLLPTPIAVGGQGVAVGGTEQLLHLIYQRLETAAAHAREALSIARSNQAILRGLEREIRSPHDVKAPLDLAPLPNGPLHAEEEAYREARAPSGPLQIQPMAARNSACDSCSTVPSPVQRIVTPPLCRQPPPCQDPRGGGDPDAEIHPEPSQGSEDSMGSNLILIEDIFHSTFTGSYPGTTGFSGPSRCSGLKNSRRKRDVVLSKMVHNIHNHVSNDRRFNGSESIKSSWNICVVKYLVEKLKTQLALSHHHYTDKELKGACVAYFLTKRREYRNAMNPYKSLKEREEKKLRSRRYRLFGSRSAIVRLFGPDDQRLWEGASEELMSDEEDSPLEPGVWVARSPPFRSAELSDLCRRLDANSKHGLRPNRVYGPPSDRLPSAEVGLLPPRLICHRLEGEDGEEEEEEEGGAENHPYVEVKVEKD
ncbi:uncharacterized protein C14orf93-like [Heptranchias perlo]|uniref:uncharacterized protein C14orf93-like n=1 Tax=Heptranchias perlo TaxID=212740 RepID=UPI00355967BA